MSNQERPRVLTSDSVNLLVALTLPIAAPAAIVLGMWRSWSYAGSSALTRREKLTRLFLVVLLVILLGFAIAACERFLAPSQNGPVGWDETSV